MKPILLLLILTGCAVNFNATDSNYAKFGTYKDRYDFLNYNYAEVGKTIPVSKQGVINASVGLINTGSDNVLQPSKNIENYWEVNYEYRW